MAEGKEQAIGKVAQEAPDIIINVPDGGGSSTGIWIAVITAAGLVLAAAVTELLRRRRKVAEARRNCS